MTCIPYKQNIEFIIPER